MFIFGHLGIGSKMVSPWTAGLRRRYVLLGTLLPDIVDKPLYYVPKLITGKDGLELGVFCGTRTFAHTGVVLLTVAAIAIARRSKVLAALALGMATHLFLDNLGDHFLPPGRVPTALLAMAWPLSGWQFPAQLSSYDSFMTSLTRPFVLGAEGVGIALLLWDQWKISHEGEILEATQERRRFFKRFRKAKKVK